MLLIVFSRSVIPKLKRLYSWQSQMFVFFVTKREKYSFHSPFFWSSKHLKYAVIFTDNTMIFSAYSTTEVTLPKPIICSWVTMWTVANSRSRRYHFFHTKSNILKTFSSSEGTTNAHLSTESTASTMSASGDTVSSCGKHSQTASTACPSAPSSTRKSFAHTAGFLPTCSPSIRSAADQQTSQTTACSAIFSGQTLTRKSLAGPKTTVASRMSLARTLSRSSFRSTIWISVEP
eukprot:29070_4